MPTRSHRSPRCEPSDATALTRLASHIDDAFHDLTTDQPGHLIRVVAKPDAAEDIELGLLPLEPGVHPADAMAGFTAPADWTAVGVVSTGRSSELDPPETCSGPNRPGQPIRLTFVLDRSGEAVTCLTPIGSSRDHRRVLHEAPVGFVADACRRVLGLATAPPAEGPDVWFAARWLDQLLAAAIEQPRAMSAWEAAVRLHPLTSRGAVPTPEELAAVVAHAAAQFDWEQLRLLAARSRAKEPAVPPSVAAWMDAGSFARHLLGAELPVELMLVELAALLPASLMTAVGRALQTPDGTQS